MPELSIFLTSPRSTTRRERRSASRRVMVAVMISSGGPITSEPAGTMTVTSPSLRVSTSIELTATVAISLIDHEDEDAGRPPSRRPALGRPSSRYERHHPQPDGPFPGGVPSVALVGRLCDHNCKTAIYQLLQRLDDLLQQLPADQR